MKSAIVEAFGAKNDLPAVGKHIQGKLAESEGGKWFASVSFEGMKSGMYWSHQEAKFSFDRDGEKYIVSIAHIEIDREKTKNVSSKEYNCTSLRLTVLPTDK